MEPLIRWQSPAAPRSFRPSLVRPASPPTARPLQSLMPARRSAAFGMTVPPSREAFGGGAALALLRGPPLSGPVRSGSGPYHSSKVVSQPEHLHRQEHNQ